jgi:hypothetical protein
MDSSRIAPAPSSPLRHLRQSQCHVAFALPTVPHDAGRGRTARAHWRSEVFYPEVSPFTLDSIGSLAGQGSSTHAPGPGGGSGLQTTAYG